MNFEATYIDPRGARKTAQLGSLGDDNVPADHRLNEAVRNMVPDVAELNHA